MDYQTTVISLAQQRKEIHDLFKKASDQAKAEKAYNLAVHYGIHQPWMSLCAYNLAHALLAKAVDEKSLLKAQSLFQDAMRAHFLGPWPALFRLAALERRNAKQTESLNRAFKNARGVLLHYRRRIASEAITPDLDPRPDFQNMLRLAAAFLGPDLTSLANESLGDAQEPKDWILVGHDPNLGTISQSRDFILQEIEALSKREKDAVFFKLSSRPLEGDDAAPLLRHWRKGGKAGAWEVVPYYPALRLLAIILSKKTTTMQGLLRKLSGGDSPAQRIAFSQNKKRLGKELMQLTQSQVEKVFVSGRGEFPEINPAIEVYGAVEKSAL